MCLFGPFAAATVARIDAVHRPSPGSALTVQEAALRPPHRHLDFDPEELASRASKLLGRAGQPDGETAQPETDGGG
jgi:hypothetical protein